MKVKKKKSSSDTHLHNIITVIFIMRADPLPSSVPVISTQRIKQTKPERVPRSVAGVYCKRRIRPQIPKGQATNKQTSKSTENTFDRGNNSPW